MYIKQYYSLTDMLLWTRRELFLFVCIAAVPVLLHQFFDLTWLHLPWLPIAVVGTAVAFIISFQNNATYDRTWEARKIWGGIVNASRSWGIVAIDFVTEQFAESPIADDELEHARHDLIFRHIAWLTALRHLLRQPRPWEMAMQDRTNREWQGLIQIREHHHALEEEVAPYLSAEELAYVLSKTNAATQTIALQSRQLRLLRKKGLIDDFRHVEMQRVLGELYTLQGKSERIKNFPYPRQYATLNYTFLWVFVLLLPFGVMHEFDKIGQELIGQFPIIGDRFVWLSIPFSVLVMWIFYTMERIGRVTENPFEGTPNDVPITTIARGIEIDLREMMNEDAATIPAPLEPQHNTQT